MDKETKAAIVIAIATILAAAISIYEPKDTENDSRNNSVDAGDISINLNVVQKQYTENVLSNSKEDISRSLGDD